MLNSTIYYAIDAYDSAVNSTSMSVLANTGTQKSNVGDVSSVL